MEKALKALQLKRTGEYSKTHDLVKLGRDVRLKQNLLDGVKELTLVYVYTRYPDTESETDLKVKSHYFLKLVEDILKWAEENL